MKPWILEFFTAQVKYVACNGPVCMRSGDFKKDKEPDLVVSNSEEYTVRVLLNNGNGDFQAQIKYATTRLPMDII